MSFTRGLLSLTCLLTFIQLPVAGQPLKKMQCPKPVRQRTYRPAPAVYLELSAGLSKPFMYRNDAGSTGGHFRFNSLASPYAAATGYVTLSDRLEAFVGTTLTQTWQGLGFSYGSGGTGISTRSYAGSLVISMPAGLRYHMGRVLQLSAAPYLSYSTHSGAKESSGSSGSGSLSGPYYQYDAPDDKHRINAGLRLAADLRITKRLGAVVGCAIDAGRAVASYGAASLGTSGSEVYYGAVEPHLLHIGAGLSYKLWHKAD